MPAASAKSCSPTAKREWLGRLALLLSSTLLGWLGLSSVFFTWDSGEDRSVIPILAEEIAQGRPAVLNLEPRVGKGEAPDLSANDLPGVIERPLGSAPRARIVCCREDEGWYLYDSDRFGFNNPDDAWDRAIDVALIGDSFAQGFCTPANVQRTLRERMNAVSLGKAGDGPLMEFATLKEFLSKYRAKNIFWLVSSNDMMALGQLESDFENEKKNPVLRRYLEDPLYSQDYFAEGRLEKLRSRILDRNKLFLKRHEGNVWAEGKNVSPLRDILSGRYLRQRIDLVTRSLTEPKSQQLRPPSSADQEAIKAIFTQAGELTKRAGARLTVVFLPLKEVYTGLVAAVPFQFLIDSLERQGIDYYDHRLSMTETPLAFYSRKTGHFNAKGYTYLARKLIEHKLTLK